VVIDNATGEVIAYQGNAREGGTHPYVDCARARRSTGSALKPLVYLLAFSKGALNPWSLLADTPQGLVGLAPRNFSGSHRGPVSARVALAESLNVPAVRVLRLVGQDEARGFLESFGLGPFGPRDYGDSLVLGGAEASLLELARAYSALARGGRDIPPTFSPAGRPDSPGGQPDGGAGPPGAPGLAPEAAVWLLNRSLSDDGRLPPALRGEGRPFKTGTSHGLRDAWFFMWSPGYTVALWMGDPSGAGHRELSGARALSGAAVGVTRALADKAPFPGPPKGLRGYLACPVSGGAATPLCPGAVKAYGLASHPRPRPCAVHVLSGGRPAVRWPSELRDFMGAMGGLSPGPQGASVVSPRPGGTLLLSPASTHVPLRAEGAAPPVHWYVDRRFLGEDRGVPPLWALRPGEHEVSFIDARGWVGSGSFTVRGAGERGREGVPALEFQ
jgi:penicillin-binding protein 1C